MRGKIFFAGLILGLSALAASAQDRVSGGGGAAAGDISCSSGIVTSEAVPRDTYVITGREASNKIVFVEGDYIYVNKGSDQGAKVGDVLSIIRPAEDTARIEWTKWQYSILNKMGTMWQDEGRGADRSRATEGFHCPDFEVLRFRSAWRHGAGIYAASHAANQAEHTVR